MSADRADILLVDGKNALWRAADAHSDLGIKQDDGDFLQTGAIYGFLTIICRFHSTFGGRLMVCWDDWENGPAHRKAMYPAYKLRPLRSALPEPQAAYFASMDSQQKRLMDLLGRLGILQVHSPGWEADDVIATVAHKYSDPRQWTTDDRVHQQTRLDFEPPRIVILTGDRDMLQCVSDTVSVARPQPKGQYKVENPKTVEDEWGVPPHRFVELKALMGDTGDNIPGVPKIGPKTASAILGEYETAEEALLAAGAPRRKDIPGYVPPVNVKPWPASLRPKWADLLREHADSARLSRRLSEVNRDAPLVAQDRAKPPDKAGIIREFMALKFKSLLTGGRLEALLSMGGAS